MRKDRNRYGCPNPDCPSFGHQKKYKGDVKSCPECGSELVHVCKSKDCYTVVEDSSESRCLVCKAKHEDKKDKGRKAAVGGGLGAAAVAPVVVKNREVIKEAAKTIIRLIKR